MARTTAARDTHHGTTTFGPTGTADRLRGGSRTTAGLLATVALAVGTLVTVAFPLVTAAALFAVAVPLLLR